MKIVDSIMPMSDVEALAANGQKLRVAVTKTSAQGKAAQSTTPNLMSFSTDENSVWFNGKMYGVHKFNNVSSLDTNSTAEQVLSALNVSKSSELYDLAHRGVLFIDTISGNTIVGYEDGDSTFQLYVPSSDSRSIKKLTITVSSNKVTGLTTISHLIVDDIRNTLISTETNKALSAAMGKKLQDEKLSKTDVVNNLTTTDTSKALSAAQGKVLNDKFEGNRININFSATSNSTDNTTIKGYMGDINGTSLVNKLTYGANLVDSSSEDWVITLQEVSATKVSFTGIKFAGFNLYSKNISVTISGSDYTNMTVAQSSRSVPAINNTLTSTSTSEALSAAQGKALNDKISGLGNVYKVKGTKSTIEEVYSISANAKLGDVWNITSAFTIGGKPYPANTNVVCIAEWSTSTTPQDNWDPLGGTVDLSTYVPKSDIVDNLSTSDSKKPLSAKQGLALATMITELEDDKETYQLLKTLESGTLSTQSGIDAILGPYSSFNAALNAGKVIHGVYKDSLNRMHTVAFSAFNDTANSRVRMFAMLDTSTLLCAQATHSGTNWTSATTSEEPFNAGITIE
ncbi:hypothetical protein M1M51_gp076 [uncultured phage cr44_1]|uniref:Uncharacterized protein n=1 Tax=uncultured phage cr44_1 TaxID=2986405 RepID=A0AAE7RWB1_9CAUD|nr:hypothetical protein M1M51_gp076 [uncultured phage cr44_1]QWM89865.1 hypothetical protein [uncultured phage cr44_1]